MIRICRLKCFKDEIRKVFVYEMKQVVESGAEIFRF